MNKTESKIVGGHLIAPYEDTMTKWSIYISSTAVTPLEMHMIDEYDSESEAWNAWKDLLVKDKDFISKIRANNYEFIKDDETFVVELLAPDV